MRFLSSGEVSTALRPFYFSVHPDLFGKHPNERVSVMSGRILSDCDHVNPYGVPRDVIHNCTQK